MAPQLGACGGISDSRFRHTTAKLEARLITVRRARLIAVTLGLLILLAALPVPVACPTCAGKSYMASKGMEQVMKAPLDSMLYCYRCRDQGTVRLYNWISRPIPDPVFAGLIQSESPINLDESKEYDAAMTALLAKADLDDEARIGWEEATDQRKFAQPSHIFVKDGENVRLMIFMMGMSGPDSQASGFHPIRVLLLDLNCRLLDRIDFSVPQNIVHLFLSPIDPRSPEGAIWSIDYERERVPNLTLPPGLEVWHQGSVRRFTGLDLSKDSRTQVLSIPDTEIEYGTIAGFGVTGGRFTFVFPAKEK